MKKQLVPLVLSLIVCLPFLCCADQDIQARFERSLEAAKSIPNAEIDWIDTLSIKDPLFLKAQKINKEKFSRSFKFAYLVSGQKFRATCSSISGTETNLRGSFESTFDGKTYCTYSGDSHYMTKNSRVNPSGDGSEGGVNPLVQPFAFLRACFSNDKNSDKITIMRFTDITSEQFAKGITLPAGQESGDLLKFSMPGRMLAGQPTTWEIVMDKAGDYFTPETITEIVPGMKEENICRLLDYTNLSTYSFPTRIEWVSSQYPATSPPTVLSTGLITVISAHIPDQISDSMFRLDNEEKDAVANWDWDSHKLTKAAPQLAKIQTEHKTARVAILLLLFTTVVILPIAIVLTGRLGANKK